MGAAGVPTAMACAAARTSAVEYETVECSDAGGAAPTGTAAGGAVICDGMYAIVWFFCFLLSGALTADGAGTGEAAGGAFDSCVGVMR